MKKILHEKKNNLDKNIALEKNIASEKYCNRKIY